MSPHTPADQLNQIAAAIHYPECWDTEGYPTLESALAEIFVWWQCSNEACGHTSAGPIKPSPVKAARQVLEAAAQACERSDRYRGDYFAAKVRGIDVLTVLGDDIDPERTILSLPVAAHVRTGQGCALSLGFATPAQAHRFKAAIDAAKVARKEASDAGH